MLSSSHTRGLKHPRASWSMPLRLPLEPFCNSALMESCVRSHFSPRSSSPAKHATVRLTESCLPSIGPSSIFITSWKGQQFCVFTDHKPLTHALWSKSDCYTPRRLRHMEYISQFTTDIRHVKGKDNPVADALSRNWVYSLSNDPSAAIDFDRMVEVQREDPELQKLQCSSSTLVSKDITLPMANQPLVCDVSTDVPHLFVPTEFCRSVLAFTCSPWHTNNSTPNHGQIRDTCGLASTKTFADGHALAFSVRDQSSSVTQSPHSLL